MICDHGFYLPDVKTKRLFAKKPCTFEYSNNKRTWSRSRWQICIFLCLYEGNCKLFLSVSTLFFCFCTIRKWPIALWSFVTVLAEMTSCLLTHHLKGDVQKFPSDIEYENNWTMMASNPASLIRTALEAINAELERMLPQSWTWMRTSMVLFLRYRGSRMCSIGAKST